MALFLQEHGYRATALLGGYDAWIKAGLDVLTSEFPLDKREHLG